MQTAREIADKVTVPERSISNSMGGTPADRDTFAGELRQLPGGIASAIADLVAKGVAYHNSGAPLSAIQPGIKSWSSTPDPDHCASHAAHKQHKTVCCWPCTPLRIHWASSHSSSTEDRSGHDLIGSVWLLSFESGSHKEAGWVCRSTGRRAGDH